MKIFSKITRNMIMFSLAVASVGTVFAASPPSQVAGVKAKLVGDSAVHLSWEEATSEEGIIVGYKIYFGQASVKGEDDSYEDEIEVEDQTSYPIENLTAGMTYYFAVTALDDELNQSVNYSEEVFIVMPGKVEEVIESVEDIVKDQAVEIIETSNNVIDNVVEQPEKSAAPLDLTSPADASGLVIDKDSLKEGNSVSFIWKKSANLDGDATDQLLFVKKGKGDWDNGYSIGKDLEQMVFDTEKDTNYKIRIVTVDSAGNRSNGISASFSTEVLATSGPGMMIPFGIVAIAMFFFLSFRKRS